MGETSGGPKFSCPNCGRDFRWKPELAGKRATCKCGRPITVPLDPPGANAPPPPAPSDDPFATFDVAGEEAASAVPPPPPPPPRAPAYGAGAVSVSAQNNCPVCGTPALPTAVMCLKCGYNFRTGQTPVGYRGGKSSQPEGGGRFAAEMYHKAAMWSWISPLIVVFTNCCCVGAIVRMSGSATSALFVAIFQLLLIIAGLGLGIFALTGVKRNGPEKILVPGIIGITLNGLIILANIVVIMLAISGHNLLNRLKKLPPPTPVPGTTTSPTTPGGRGKSSTAVTSWQIESAFVREGGWVGATQYHGATITLATLSDASDVGQAMAGRVDEPVSVALLTVDNAQGEAEFPIDPTGGNVVVRAGDKFELPDMAKLLGEKKDELVTPPPFTVPKGGQLLNKVIYLPPEVDARQISRVTISVDGNNVAIQGRYMTAKEKQKAARGQ
jgi:hypothetical protein